MTDRSSEPTLILQSSDIRIVVHGSPFRCIRSERLLMQELDYSEPLVCAACGPEPRRAALPAPWSMRSRVTSVR